MKRTITMLLVLLMVATLFAGCSGEPEEVPTPTPTPTQGTQPTDEGESEGEPDVSEVDGNALPLADGDVTFEVWWGMYDGAAPYISDLATNIAWSEIIKRTGVNLNFISPSSAMEAEQFNLMIASQDYPDIIKGAGTLYTGGVDKAIDEGVYLRLNDLIKEYAPNYMRRLVEPEDNTKDAMTDSGNMIFAQIYNRRQSGFFGPLIRQDWLDDLGLEVPSTIADWENVLTKFKDEKTGGIGPLQFSYTGFNFGENFSGAYGVGGSSEGSAMILVDGKVEYSFLMPEMRDYLETMNRWYTNNLIDREFVARGFLLYADTARLANDEIGAFISFFNQGGSFYRDNGIVPDEDFYLTLAPIPSLNEGEQATVGLRMSRVVAGQGAVTTACEDPVLAVKFIDYLFSDEGALLANYGIEGETFNYNEDNKPILADLIIANEDGMTATNAQFTYLIHNGPMYFYLDREEDVLDEEGKKYITLWDLPYPRTITGISFTAEEATTKSNIMNDVNTFVSENVVKFIMGDKSFDEYDAFVEQIKSMDIDKVIQIYSDAYQRYQNR